MMAADLNMLGLRMKYIIKKIYNLNVFEIFLKLKKKTEVDPF